MSNEKQRNALVEAIWTFIKERGANKTGYPDIDIRLSDIKESVFLLEDELRISGERGNNFSDFYVNYYDSTERWQQLLTHLSKKGWLAEWFCPGYIVAYEEGVNA